MDSARKWISLLAGLLPIAYCGGLVWYFTDMGGLDNPIISQELKPTIIGLALVGLVFIAMFAFRIWRANSGPGTDTGTGAPGAPKPRGFVSALDQDDDVDHTDTDAMIARYLAQRATPTGTHESPIEAAPRPGTFGRRVR